MNRPVKIMEKPVLKRPGDFEIVYAPPSVEDFLALRKLGNLGEKDPIAMRESLARSAFAIQVLHEGRCIGFCRTLSDGALWYMMADGVILPEYQAGGIGKFLVSSLIYNFYENAAPGGRLLAITHAPDFGVKSGFNRFPSGVTGGFAWVPPELKKAGRFVNPISLSPLQKGEGYQVSYDSPDLESFQRLRALSGLAATGEEAARISLSNSLMTIKIDYLGKTVAFARILGETFAWAYMVDVCADPAHDADALKTHMIRDLSARYYEKGAPGAYMLFITDRIDLAKTAGLTPVEPREICLYADQPPLTDSSSMDGHNI